MRIDTTLFYVHQAFAEAHRRTHEAVREQPKRPCWKGCETDYQGIVTFSRAPSLVQLELVLSRKWLYFWVQNGLYAVPMQPACFPADDQ